MEKANKTRGALLGIVFALAMVAALIPQLAEPAYAADPVYDITFYHDSIYGEGVAGHLTGSSTEWDHPTWGSDTWVGSARLRPKVYYEAGNDHFTLKVNISRMNGAHQPGGNYVSGTVKYNGHTITFKNWGPFGCGSNWVDIRFERSVFTFNYNGGRNYNQNTDNITVDHYWYNANNFSIVDTYNGKNFDIENQPYWAAYMSDFTGYMFDGWWTEATGGTRITPEDITKHKQSMTLYAHWEQFWNVDLVGGSWTTPSRGTIDSYGHHETKVVRGQEMEPVIFTANEGYHIDHKQIAWNNASGVGFDEYTENGVTVERISDTHYVASGTPTGPVTIYIPSGHKYGDWTTTTAATCTTAGEKERVCSKDSTIKETATIPIDSNAHSYNFKDFTWTGDETSGYTAAKANYVCEHDATHTTSVDATIGEVILAPTCTKPGKTTYTATVAATDSKDGQEHTESKDAKATDPTDHKWKFEGFTWTGNETDGYAAATANYVCENDSTHTTTAEATISEKVTDPTCTEPGKTTYTATVVAEDSPDGEKREESKDAKATDPTDHKWKFTEITWTGNDTDGYTAATAHYVCERDGTHTNTADATISDAVIKPTCIEPGKTIQTATIAKADSPDGKEHTESKDAKPTDPINHKWKFTNFTWTGSEADGYTAAVANYVCERDNTHTDTADATISDAVIKPTCTESGKTTYTATVAATGSLDGQEHTDSKDAKPTDPLQHDWGKWTQTKAPTCIEQGEEEHVCKRDATHRETREVADPNAHKYGDWTKVDDKQHQRVCEHDATHVEKSNHTWDAGKVTKKATKTSTGEKTYTCTLCEATKTETIPKLKPESTAKSVLVAKAIAKGSKAGKISWNKVKGADRYVIYLSNCNGKGEIYKPKKVKTVSGKTYKWTRKKLKENRSYKFYVVAQKKSGGSYKTIAMSKISHFYTGNERGRFTNPKSLKLKKSTFTLKKGKTATIKASVTKVRKNKKLSKNHTAMYRYISNDPSVAAVSSKGKITAKKTGTAVIYVQTINGIWKTCKVTVK